MFRPPQQQQQAQQQAQMAAQQEMMAITDLYSRMQEKCYQKCIGRLGEAELSIGETQCIDRCVAKYLEVHTMVGGKLSGQETPFKK